MSSVTTPVKGATAALGAVFLAAALWVMRGYVWPTLSNVEVGPLQAMLDPSLFRGDFTVQESLRFSPRFYYNALILLPARAGLPLAWSFALWHLLALGALVTAVRAFANSVGLGAVAAAVLMVWLLTANVGALGGVYFYTHAPVPAVWAGAVAAWGAAFAARGRLAPAFACFGAAALLQFLVGFYAGLLALPALWRARPQDWIRAFLPWAAGLGLVHGPLTISGWSDAGVLSNEAFVEIYARLRHPHHLLPSTWPWPAWQRAIWFYAGAWFFLHRTAEGRPAFERVLVKTSVLLAAAALALNYLFVEVIPVALIAKLQPARITPLAQAIIFGLLATRIQVVFARRQWLHGAALCLIPLSLFPGLLLVLAAIFTPAMLARPETRWPTYVFAAATVIAFRPFGGSLAYHAFRYGPWLALFMVQLVPHVLRNRRLALAGTAALAAAAAAYCAHASSQPGWPALLASRFSVDAPPGDALALLGDRFRTRSAHDALVLVPPTSEAWSFKLYAQRAVVVDDKNISFTPRGLREWHARMEHVLGVPFTPGVDAAAAWRAQKNTDLLNLATRYGARHILTRDEWHPELSGRRFDYEQGWSLWELPSPP